MRKLIYPCLIALALILFPLSACQADSTTTATIESADDIVFTPGGCAYRANVHQQGVENPWPSVETVEVALQHNNNTINVRYRDYIVTEAGSTRNNLINVNVGTWETVEVNLSTLNTNTGIEVTQGNQNCGRPGHYREVLVIKISPDVQPGEYYGTLTCTLNIVEQNA